MLKKKKGFTLIEMSVVLLIIAMLMLLILPNINAQKEKATERADKALVATIQTQIELEDDAKTVTLESLHSHGSLSDDQMNKAKEKNIVIDKGIAKIGKKD